MKRLQLPNHTINIKQTSIFSKFFCFHNLFPSYTHATTEEGVQNSDEWSSEREKQLSINLDIDQTFRLTLYENLSKVKSTQRLLNSFDFSKYVKIGAIGDSPFVQSIVINDYLNKDVLNRRKTARGAARGGG
jgi:hypothetical protein